MYCYAIVIIKQHNVDLFTICESWQERKATYRCAPCVQPDIGVSISPVRPVGAPRRVSGGIVLIYRESIIAK